MRDIEFPSLGRSVSALIAHPSSAEPESHFAGLNAYFINAGAALHLHGEGGETHSRAGAGRWLATHLVRPSFFLCTQVCHDAWDDEAKRSICRFTGLGLWEDVGRDLELIGTDYLDMVYLDDRPGLAFEPAIDALRDQIEACRVRSIGVRNFRPDRLRAIDAYARHTVGVGIGAVVTTELSPFTPTQPMWPEYVPFDAELQQTVIEMGLGVFAHATDVTLGQCLFGDEDALARMRPEWLERWQTPENESMAARIQQIAEAHRSTPRSVSIAWILSRPFPVAAIVSLPAFCSAVESQYTRAVDLRLGRDEF